MVAVPLSAGILLASYFRRSADLSFVRRESGDMRRLVLVQRPSCWMSALCFLFVPLPFLGSIVAGLHYTINHGKGRSTHPVDAVLSTIHCPNAVSVRQGDTFRALEVLAFASRAAPMAGRGGCAASTHDDLAARQVDDPMPASQLPTSRQSFIKARQPQVATQASGWRADRPSPRDQASCLPGDGAPMNLLS